MAFCLSAGQVSLVKHRDKFAFTVTINIKYFYLSLLLIMLYSFRTSYFLDQDIFLHSKEVRRDS